MIQMYLHPGDRDMIQMHLLPGDRDMIQMHLLPGDRDMILMHLRHEGKDMIQMHLRPGDKEMIRTHPLHVGITKKILMYPLHVRGREILTLTCLLLGEALSLTQMRRHQE